MLDSKQEQDELKRVISLPFLILYGLGTMVGGGIYALIGKVAGIAGMYAPISFTLSALLALITIFSYAEMSARFPYSAGEVRYVSAAFNRKRFSQLVGWLVIFTGMVSAAALANATAGFIQDFIFIPTAPLIVMVIFFLGAVAAWGITESLALVTLITLIEVGGLFLVIFTGWGDLAALETRWPELIPTQNFYDIAILSSILSGAFLAFYAFIGFEDMVNVAEEVKDVRRTMPIAIITCMIMTLLIYVLVSLIAVLSVPPHELAQSNTPMSLIMERHDSNIPPSVMGLISMLASVNGALVQMIMGARVLYGMAKGGEAPKFFANVNTKTQTPLRATVVIIIVAFIFALMFDLTTLARMTSTIILFIFACVNASLLKLKWNKQDDNKEAFTVPFWLPLCGVIICCIMLSFEIWQVLVF